MKRFYLLALAATLAFTGCKKDDGDPRPENLTIEKTEYALDAVENRTATVSFSAPADWTLSVVYDDAESSADWLSVTPMSGTAGEQTVELSAARNFRTSDRTAYADLVCGEQSVRLTVTQTAASEVVDFTAQFDPGFAQKLQELGIIADADNITPEDMEKIAAITSLDVAGSYDNPGTLTSLRGIEYFESLTFLKCDSNQLTTLDVSANTALTYLYCHSNQLTTLDVRANTALTTLSCSSNSLTKLDVRQNTELMNLSCSSNSLTSLDVSRNTALTGLWCESNQLTELNVSANTALTQLHCGSNQLTELDVRQNTALTGLWCYDNQLTELDISRNTALTYLHCGSNQLTSLDVRANTALETLSCDNNPGDGESKFPITAWFDTKPENLTVSQTSWTYGGKTITIDFRKAE